MNWIQRKIILYEVTFGLYGLDWWEKYTFNAFVISLFGFIGYGISCLIAHLFRRYTPYGEAA